MNTPEQAQPGDDSQSLVTLSPVTLPTLLYSLALALAAVHIAMFTFYYRVGDTPWLLEGLFDLDREDAIPTWFSSTVLLLASGLLLAVARVAYRTADRLAGYWLGLAAGFLVLSMDEVAGFHETFNSATDTPWTLAGAALVVIIGLGYSRFLIRLPAHLRWRLLLAGTLFVGGAIGVERGADYYVDVYGTDNLGYNLLTALEETLEMLGAIALVQTLLLHLSNGVAGGALLLGVEQTVWANRVEKPEQNSTMHRNLP